MIDDEILVDCGVSFKRLAPYYKQIKLVLLTHAHGDHLRPSTVRALARLRPALRIGCCEWMVYPLLQAGVQDNAIDVFDFGSWYDYGFRSGLTSIKAEKLYHNVPNCGYHIYRNNEKLFYATDTGNLTGVQARGYDYYLVEANYTEDEIRERIDAKRAAGDYVYEADVIHNHLSQEQAFAWLGENADRHSQYMFLHQHVDSQKEKEEKESYARERQGLSVQQC